MRSAATNSCVCGVSAVTMQPEERLAARASARATAALTSAVPSTQVRSSARRCVLRSRNRLAPLEKRSVRLVCAFSPALPCLLGQAYRAWALLWCPQPCDGAPVLGRPGWGTQETLSMCGRSPVSASGVSLHLKSWLNLVTDPKIPNFVLPGEGLCALKRRIPVKKIWQIPYTQK